MTSSDETDEPDGGAAADGESSSGPERRRSLMELPWLGPESKRRWRDRAFVMGAAALMFLPLLGSFGLWDPWETHYGEVARQITERHDWISTWWGSHWPDSQGQTEGSPFYSKPVFLMWMMAAGMKIFGFSEWGIRIGVTLIAIVVLGAVYTMASSIFRRRTGFVLAGVLGTSPFFFFMSRQAQTDMPYVGMMTIGFCFFMMAVFGEDRDEPADKLTWGLTLAAFSLLILPQLWVLLVGLLSWQGHPSNPVMLSLTRRPMLGLTVGGAPLLLGAAGLALGLWLGRSETDEARDQRKIFAWAALGAAWIPLLVVLVLALVQSPAPGLALAGWWTWGPVHAAIYGTCFGGAIYSVVANPSGERRDLYMLVFYVCVAVATLSKGLLGFLLPGAVLFFYITLTREWRMLKRVQFLPGTLLFIATAFPWYAGMLIEHTRGFWARFFVHDHFKRLASGVHEIDTGSFEHFIRWLGYGLFPWSALIPAALGQYFTGRGLRMDNDRARARLMILLWATISFTLFTLSSTKFHHYIFPVVPPLAMLVGLAVDDALDREVPEPWPLYVVAIGLLGIVGWDLLHDPQNLKDLFTYKYERQWDGETWNAPFRFWMAIVMIPGAVGALWLLVKNRLIRRIAFGLVFVTGLGMAVFGLHYYMPTISSTWSQKGVWDAYYSHCNRRPLPDDPAQRERFCRKLREREHQGVWETICGETRTGAEYYDPKKRYCEEEAIAYKLNWRGETFYTQNQVLPLRDNQDWESFIQKREGEPFYGIMQRGRFRGGFKRNLPEPYKGEACMIYRGNIKFVLVKAPCTEEDEKRARELFGPEKKRTPPEEWELQ